MPDDRFLHRRAGHSQKVNLLTDLEFRVWTQYLLSADDFGVMRCSAITLQADNDHLANRSVKVITRCLDALAKPGGLLRTFEHQGRRYLYQHDWQTWQKVAYPRQTTEPSPPSDALAQCDQNTLRLFSLHPGGAGKKRTEHSQNIPEIVSEDSPLMRAGTPAKRLTAMANGSGYGERPEIAQPRTERLDLEFQKFRDTYPENRRKGGRLVEGDYLTQVSRAGGPEALIEALNNHLASAQWRDPKLIPNMDRWLKEERWRQTLSAVESVPQGAALPPWAEAAKARKAAQS